MHPKIVQCSLKPLDKWVNCLVLTGPKRYVRYITTQQWKKQVFDSQAKCTVGSEKTINGSQHNISLVACHLYSPFFSCLFLATPFPLSFQNKRQKTHFSVSPFPKTPLQKSRGCHVFEAFTPLCTTTVLYFSDSPSSTLFIPTLACML